MEKRWGDWCVPPRGQGLGEEGRESSREGKKKRNERPKVEADERRRAQKGWRFVGERRRKESREIMGPP